MTVACADIEAPGARPSGRTARPGVAVVESLMGYVGASRLWHGVGAVLVVILTVGAVLFSRAHHDTLPAAAFALAVVATAPLVLLRRWPLLAVGLVVAANGVFVVVSRLPWSPTAVLTWLVALIVCPLVLTRRCSLVVLAGTEVAVLAAAWVPSSVNARPWDTPITEALAVLLVWGAAESLRIRRESAVAQAAVTQKVRDLQERDAHARGRAEIARELHDVVAHHVSLIAVRAATATYQVDDVSPAAQEVFAEIAAQARTALEELRTVLGVLRTPEGAAPLAPQPGLDDVGGLVERMRANGMHVTVQMLGSQRPLPDTVGLCCYRVIQEALTNAARHAPGAPVQITVGYDDTEVVVTISDSAGIAASPRGAGPAGFGLIGMRERVTALGGQLHAGPDTSGFRVRAHIPSATVGYVS